MLHVYNVHVGLYAYFRQTLAVTALHLRFDRCLPKSSTANPFAENQLSSNRCAIQQQEHVRHLITLSLFQCDIATQDVLKINLGSIGSEDSLGIASPVDMAGPVYSPVAEHEAIQVVTSIQNGSGCSKLGVQFIFPRQPMALQHTAILLHYLQPNLHRKAFLLHQHECF